MIKLLFRTTDFEQTISVNIGKRHNDKLRDPDKMGVVHAT